MRANLPPNAERIEDAPCGCERYSCVSFDHESRRLDSTVCLHTCAAVQEESDADATVVTDAPPEEPQESTKKPARKRTSSTPAKTRGKK